MLVSKKAKYLVISAFCAVLISSFATAKLSGSLSPEAISERLRPIGQVNVMGGEKAAEGDAPVLGLGGPEKIYNDNCKICHQPGLAGAPKLGNKAEWAPRTQQGFETLVKHAWVGIRAMPPKGNCLKCTEEDVRETVQYMLDTIK